ncbi:hypothetical protein J4Q44_G00332670 [Coregonus suidteri]|uniref:PH domain-containing protein n=1 Tax=Coregonus suidteri TaxID=861788 RepID=A0AAN8KIT4_9TELE
MHKRFFVLRAASAGGPSRLEYYENEKKWRHKSGVPKRSIPLESCFNINKRADSKNKYLVALYTKDEYFSIAADSEQEQDRWHQALVDLHNKVGRSAVTGPGEFWMQVDDSVVAQNMHETILEAMKAMSEEFRPRSKSHSSSNCSNPISVPLRRHHHNNLPPSQVGLGRRSRAESVTAISPAGPGKHSHSFRVRASSDGEGTMSRPASVDGSPCVARTQSHRHRGASRLHPPLNHSRSIPMPSSRCSPSAISPVSLSSSSTSGHGSTSDCLYPRRSSASISGSPIDGGFISSDEYGSSPCDFRSSFRSVTPESLGHTPPAREEELNNYICMAKPATLPGGHCGCSPHPHRTPSHLDELELEKCFRKRTHSLSTSPPTVCHQKTPSQSSTVSLEEYTVMQPAYLSCSRASSYRHSAFMPTHSYPEEGIDIPLEDNRVSQKDDGYMPMTPGVAPATGKSADYMPMSPKSVSAPQQINSRQHPRMDSNGYMMMSPSGSCSPDTTNYGQIWTNGVNPKLSVESTEEKLSSCGDYMNMSPASCSMISTPPDCYFNLVEEPPKSMYAYFSLPRSFKHSHRKLDQNPLRLSLSSGRLAFGDSSSSSTSSDSLGGQGHSGQPVVKPKRADVDSRLARPTSLSLEGNKASTLPRARECPFPAEPKSPGEYVNIVFNDKAFSASLATLFSPVFPGSGPERPAEISSDYMNMHLGAQGRDIPCWAAKPPASCTDGYAIVAPAAPSSVIHCENLCRRDYSSTQTDYSNTEMILNAPVSAIDVTPFSVSPPSQDLSVLGAGPSAVHLGLMGPLSGLSAFTRVNSSSIWNQGAKVIRADQQGRRRHSSETFSSTGAPVSAASSSVGEVKRHSSASFENVWLKPGESPLSANGRRESPPGPSSNGQNQNRLNYIDLDLARDQNLPEWSSLQARARDMQGGSAPEDLRAYASIRFQKADESRMNPAHREGKTARSL